VNFWTMTQIVVDLFLCVGLVILVIKRNRPAADDPRLSRGLQLLQTKISVLEDLSDRTEHQVHQLTQLLEVKAKEVQSKITEIDVQMQKLEQSRAKSMEVANIFQDRIPHQEIIERQNTKKYIQAARLAHQGLTASEIANQVNLPIGEIEFIAKVNRDNLQFSEAALPEWAQTSTAMPPEPPAAKPISERPLGREEDKVSLSDLGDKFRKALKPNAEVVQAPVQIERPNPSALMGTNSKGESVQVKRVVFPRVDSDR